MHIILRYLNISISVFYPVKIDSYNHFKFADWLIEYFHNQPCILCHKNHDIEIYQYRERNISPDNKKKKIVVRIRCKNNQKKREETGEDLQYTITILPHSRVPIPQIFDAFDEYFNEEITQQQATLLMNCNSRHSFNLFLKRFSSRFTNLFRIWQRFFNYQN